MYLSYILILILLVAGVAPAALEGKKAPVCGSIDAMCKDPSDCCSGCCTSNKCSDCSHSPCTFHDCPPDKVCYLQKVNCLQAPCNPIPACMPPNDPDYDYTR